MNDSLDCTAQLLLLVLPKNETFICEENIGKHEGEEISILNYLNKRNFQQNHKCDWDKCRTINESGAILMGYLPTRHKVMRDDVYLGICGYLHVCHKGGDLVSPCVIDMKKYTSTGDIICKITNRKTQFPPLSFFDCPLTSQVSAEYSSETIHKFSENYRNDTSKEKKSRRAGKARNDETKLKNTIVEKKTEIYLNIKDTVVPFNHMDTRSRMAIKIGDRRHKVQKTHHNQSPGRRLPESTRRGGKVKQRIFRDVGANLQDAKTKFDSREQNSENPVFDSNKTEIPREMSDRVGRFVEPHRRNLEYDGIFDQMKNGAFLDRLSPEENDKKLFSYFSDYPRIAQLEILFSKASTNAFFGNKADRFEVSKNIVETLFYSPERRKSLHFNSYNRKLKCAKELYQHYASSLNMAYKRGEKKFPIDLMSGLPIIGKYYGSSGNVNAGNLEVELKTRNSEFVSFFCEMCWLQWAVICASPHGMTTCKKYIDEPMKNGAKARNTEVAFGTGMTINFTNCCLSVLYGMVDGQTTDQGKVIIPNVEYVSRYAPPTTDIAKYGFRKKMLTSGVNQRILAYRTLHAMGQLDLLCKFDFST